MLDTNLNDVVRRVAFEMGGEIAYRTPTANWSFAEVNRQASRVAQGFISLGIGHEDRVACLTKYIVETTVLAFGANKAGAVCVPVNWRLSADEIGQIICHGEARFLMVDEEFLPVVRMLELPAVRKIVVTEQCSATESFADWCGIFPATDPGHVPMPNDTTLQPYSSGTTGLPKGVEISHRNLLAACETLRHDFGYESGRSVTFHTLPTFHIAGLVMSIGSFTSGIATVAFPKFEPASVITAFAEHRITHTYFVAAMIHALLQEPGVEYADFSSLEVISYGASPISEKVLVDALHMFKCGFVQMYGLTETTGAVVDLLPEDHDPGGPKRHLLRSAGRPVPGVSMRIVDTATGNDLPDGKVGEVWILSEQNLKSYWRNVEATREAYPEGRENGIGWFRTGDAGYSDKGYLFIKDRIKDIIISGGENIYPAEVENVLMQHPFVKDCAIIAVPDEKWGESVKACVVLQPDAQSSSQDIIDFMRERIAHFKCPRSVDFLETLPRNPSGKILKKILRGPYWKDAG